MPPQGETPPKRPPGIGPLRFVPADRDTEAAARDRPVTRLGRRQPRLLARSVILEEMGVPHFVRVGVIAVGFVVAAFIIWSAATEIDEVTHVPGEVIPVGQVQTVQHLEGGIISEILVSNGDIVDEADVLIRLDAASAHAELKEMKARLTGLQLRAERLRAFAEERQPDFADVEQPHENMLADQQSVYAIQDEARRSRRQVLDDQIRQRQAQVAVYEQQERTYRQIIALLQEELGIRRPLLAEGLAPKTEVLEVQRQLTQAMGEFARFQGERQAAIQALAESRSRLAEMEAGLREQALSEMGSVTNELAEVRETVARLEDRVRRLEITAPTRGIVNGLTAHTLGGVIAPGDAVLEIVPLDKQLVVETRIATTEIGHVGPGQPVTVKVLTYDFARYGGIPGTLSSVSASTFVDEEGIPYYRGTVLLDRVHVGIDPEQNPVLPGMTVQADVKTGRKTLLEYLLKPVYASVDEAFSER